MKGSLRIGGSVAFGVLIILGALYTQANRQVGAEVGSIVADAPDRTYIETKDSDGDGVKDWEEDIRKSLFATIPTPTSTVSLNADESYTPPTTLTGKFSEAFLEDYLQGKMDGVDFSDPSTFVSNAVAAIEQNTASTRHSRLELRNIVDTTPETLSAYGNRVGEILQKNSIENEHEVLILQRALDSNDPEELEALGPIQEVYLRTIADLLTIPVPIASVDAHVALLNAQEAIQTDIGAMRQAFTDPLLALARIKEYEKNAQTLLNAFNGVLGVLTTNGVSYRNDEPGALLYLFAI